MTPDVVLPSSAVRRPLNPFAFQPSQPSLLLLLLLNVTFELFECGLLSPLDFLARVLELRL